MTTPAGATRAVTLTGSADVLDLLRQRLTELGVPVTDITPLDSAGDALDAPFSGKKFVAALGIVTAVLNAGTAGLKFAEQVEQVLQDHPAATVVVSDARTNEPLLSASSTTSAAELAQALWPGGT